MFQNVGKAINNFTCTPSRRAEDSSVTEEHYTNEQEQIIKTLPQIEK